MHIYAIYAISYSMKDTSSSETRRRVEVGTFGVEFGVRPSLVRQEHVERREFHSSSQPQPFLEPPESGDPRRW